MGVKIPYKYVVGNGKKTVWEDLVEFPSTNGYVNRCLVIPSSIAENGRYYTPGVLTTRFCWIPRNFHKLNLKKDWNDCKFWKTVMKSRYLFSSEIAANLGPGPGSIKHSWNKWTRQYCSETTPLVLKHYSLLLLF